jgi:hypothetical protein
LSLVKARRLFAILRLIVGDFLPTPCCGIRRLAALGDRPESNPATFMPTIPAKPIGASEAGMISLSSEEYVFHQRDGQQRTKTVAKPRTKHTARAAAFAALRRSPTAGRRRVDRS